MKKAIVLRAPTGAGKSTIAQEVEKQCIQRGATFGAVTLDSHLMPTERRYAATSAIDRYEDLHGRHEDVLFVELGYAEPFRGGRPPPHFPRGATRDPRQWLEVLDLDARAATYFRLTLTQAEWERRHGIRGTGTVEDARWHYNFVSSDEENRAFCQLSRLEENVIDVTTLSAADAARQILAKLGI